MAMTINSAATSSHHTALPAQVTPSPCLTTKRAGHTRSASLENANSFLSKNTLGLPIVQTQLGVGHTGTLKSRNEQKRMRNKFGSHSNLDDFMQQGRAKFQNIRQMFEISKRNSSSTSNASSGAGDKDTQQQPQHQQQQQQQLMMQSLPPTLNTAALIQNSAGRQSATPLGQQQHQQQQAQPQTRTQYQQQHHQIQPAQQKQHQEQQRQAINVQQQPHQLQQQERCASDLSHVQQRESTDQATNLVRPIAFKPIPFEPDYSITNRFAVADVDRYGSTPSLVPVQGANMRFGSTTDLRHGVAAGGGVVGAGGFIVSGSGSGVGFGVGAYSSSNYCNSLMARRRGSRSLKINDSMESIRHTPDSDANSQSSTIKSNCNTNGNNNSNNSNKYTISEQCDMTPSPSDSGISELEAALKDRDSELSYLRQTMEHNEKVIFKVQKDKEAYWENETKRLKAFYEGQQREYLLKMKKMEQMIAMQQFQMKQHKMRHTEQTNKLREQLSDMKNEHEILRSNSSTVKNSERNLKDRVAFIEEELEKSENLISSLKAQLEESEWKVCERNGEIALLKTQLKEANLELTMKEHAIVHLKHENTNVESQIYQSLQENHNLTQQQRQIVEEKAQNEQQIETEIKQLNKIVILKDQVILALTNELAKLRKELSDLAISHEYGEEPSGKFTRLKQQLDNLTEICQKTRKHAKNSQHLVSTEDGCYADVVDAANIELIMNCLKLAPTLHDESDDELREAHQQQQSTDKRLAKISADIQKFVYGSQNLPDIAVNTSKPHTNSASNKTMSAEQITEADLDTLIKESASYAEEIAKLRHQLDNVRVNFELEKQQWCEEKEKVLSYQKQLQAHYINMYRKLRSLENLNVDQQ